MVDVFVSYSQHDEGRVSPLVSALTSAGLSVFWDRKIPHGKIWRDSIGAALTEARCVVVVWSEAAIKSDWVAEEAQEGKKRKILVPVRLDSVIPPLGFRSIQVADLSHWTGNNNSKAIKELIENVCNVITDAQDARLKRVAPSDEDHLIDDLKTSMQDLDPGIYLQPRFIHNITREVLFIEKPDNENNNACTVPEEFKVSARQVPRPKRIFLSYSHKDKQFLERILVHLKPLETAGLMDTWVDTRLKAGDRWKENIEAALQSASVAVLLVSADFLASDFIVKNELPPMLAKAERDGTRIIPIVLKPCRFSREPNLSVFQSLNSPDLPLSRLDESECEIIYDQLAQTLEEYVRSA
jgi:hypothetical protein